MLDIDGPIYVADFGGDGPVMLLVHGLGGAHLNWMSVAPQLAGHHRVTGSTSPVSVAPRSPGGVPRSPPTSNC